MPSGVHAPAKNLYRTAAFRDAARAIVYKDCYYRKASVSVDTASAIAGAFEKAYARALAEAQDPSPTTS
jgi:hypothetical protein